MQNTNNFSVVMPVYKGDHLIFFQEAINSILNQSLLPNEIILVIDGPVKKPLEDLIIKITENRIINCIWLKENVGRGAARNIGILESKCNLIALMDADDISDLNRFENQINFINQGYDVVGGYISEFQTNLGDESLIRKVPKSHSEIIRRGKFLQPINNVTIMLKKEIYFKAGGYKNLMFIEDYDLFFRMYSVGARFLNLSLNLVYVRVLNEQYHRRRGKKYFLEELSLQNEMYQKKYVSTPIYLFNIVIRVFLRFMPVFFLKFVTRFFLREKI
jgi:glycosyltransferase involved in cell wall biosynthesis